MARSAAVARYRRDYSRVTALYQDNLAIQRQSGSTRGMANLLNGLGDVARHYGDLLRAVEQFRESLAICWQFGKRWMLADTSSD